MWINDIICTFQAKTKAPETMIEDGIEAECKPRLLAFDAFDAAHLWSPAQALNTDPDLWVFRRFGQLHLFNLLHLQQRLTHLEQQLHRQVADAEPRDFKFLIQEIKQTLAEYDAALSAQANFHSYKKPTQDILKQLDTCAVDSGFGNCHLLEEGLGRDSVQLKDLASIAVADKTWTHRFIDRHHFLRKRFTNGESSGLPIYVYSEANVRFAEEVFVNATFCFLLVCPVIVLSYLSSKLWRLIFVTLCLLVVSAFSGGFLNTPNRANLAFMAGYAAVLVVFVLNNSGS
ncbi:hypothetical protein B0O99DRAFT_606757 [Bisporella sp. PMI_857]|nr:hypothetical protein B0O99DRAFT_606757 [Bisporella sp. PMI_857]